MFMDNENINYMCDSITHYLFRYFNIEEDRSGSPYCKYNKMIESISSNERKRILRNLEIDILNSDDSSERIGLEIRRDKISNLNIDENISSYDHNNIEVKEFIKELNRISYDRQFDKYELKDFDSYITKMLIEVINEEVLRSTVGIEEIEVSSMGELEYQVNLFDVSNRGYQVSGIFDNNIRYNRYGNFDIGYNRILLSPEMEGIVFRHSGLSIFNVSDVSFRDIIRMRYSGYVGILSPERSKIININMDSDFFR